MPRAREPVPPPPAGWTGPGSEGAYPAGGGSPGWAPTWDAGGADPVGGQPWLQPVPAGPGGPRAPLSGTPPGYAAPSHRHAAYAPEGASLALEIARSDPRNPDHQAMLLARIRELRASMPADAHSDLAASLEMASTLTQYLIRMGGLGPEDVLQIVSRLIGEVERMSRGRPRQVVLGAKVGPDGLRLIGKVDETRGRLLGEIMIQLGFCTRQKVNQALKIHKATGVRLGEALVGGGAATWEQVKRAISVQNQIKKG